MDKRVDLQCLRGIAVVEVILFHFLSPIFPNGYIGVDVFFVLSGFFMSLILHRDKSDFLCILKNFYYSRLKRIFPAYAMFFFITLLLLYIIYPITNIDTSIEAAFPSLYFYSTFLQEEGKNRGYKALVQLGANVFTHTWCLAVEIQFYLLIPFFYAVGRYMGQRKSFCLFLLLSTASFLFYIFANRETAFNNVFCRIWQFLCGYQAYSKLFSEKQTKVGDACTSVNVSITEDNKKINSKENDQNIDWQKMMIRVVYHSLFLIIAFSGLTPIFTFSTDFLRALITVAAAFLLYTGDNISTFISKLKPLAYLGDISYILYLIHYPVYVYLNLRDEPIAGWRYMGLIISLVLAIIIHETYEKFYLKLQKVHILSLVFVLYAMSTLIIVFNGQVSTLFFGSEIDFRSIDSNASIQQIVRLNNQLSRDDDKMLTYPLCEYVDGKAPFAECNIQGTKTNGSSLMILGNAYAPNNLRVIYPACKDYVKNVTMHSNSVCEVIWDSTKIRHSCAGNVKQYLQLVKKAKPDYLFLISRHISLLQFGKHVSKKTEDQRTAIVKRNILNYAKHVNKKVYILQAFWDSPALLTKKLNARLLKQKQTHNLFPEGFRQDSKQNYKATRRIIERAVAKCSKCKLLDLKPFFTDENHNFNFYNEDNGLGYFVDNKHISSYGLEMIKPLYENTCKSFN